MSAQAVLQLAGLGKSYTGSNGDQTFAVEAVDLAVAENEFVCVVGPSGCGKSTLLRMCAGLETASQGRVLYRGEAVDRPRKQVGLVFQEYSLLPWRTVMGNIELGPEFAGMPAAQRRKQAMRHLELVGLADFANALPHELSGGMRQRVAIARALCNQPDVLLMDEPFGALDAHTRILLQKELLKVWERRKTTILFVTHSVDEALWLADRVLVMSSRPGRVLADLPITLPRPRNRAEPLFGALTDRILTMLETGQPL